MTWLAMLALVGGLAAQSAPSWPTPPDVPARAYLVVDAETGQSLAERDADQLRAVASTIKILTVWTALQRAELDEVVTIAPEAAGVGGAGVGVRPGQEWTVEQLAQATIVRSGNDAATALAIHVGGSVDGFTQLMRDDAAGLGLDGFTIESPTGLDDANRLSARHLAELARAAMLDPDFRRIAGERTYRSRSGQLEAGRNLLLVDYPGATGIKTGQTAAAGWSVVGSAERDDREVIAVVLDAGGDAQRFTTAATLLTYGLDGFENTEFATGFRLRRPGVWVDYAPDRVATVTVPRGATAEVVQSAPTIASEDPALARAELEGVTLATWDLRPDATEATDPPQDEAGIGSWLWDRAYAAMRATTNAGEWPG